MPREARLMNPSDLRTFKCYAQDNRNFGRLMQVKVLSTLCRSLPGAAAQTPRAREGSCEKFSASRSVTSMHSHDKIKSRCSLGQTQVTRVAGPRLWKDGIYVPKSD